MSVKIDRLNSTFEKEISKILAMEVKNPDVKFVTVTGCEISNDLSVAKVYFTVLDEDKKEVIIKALDKSKSFIIGEISKRVEMRHTPEIRFIFDESIEYGKKIDSIIDKIHEQDDFR